jgi:hypothetical protein
MWGNESNGLDGFFILQIAYIYEEAMYEVFHSLLSVSHLLLRSLPPRCQEVEA